MNYDVKSTKRFRKDMKKLSKAGNFDMRKLQKVIETLAKGEELSLSYKNHLLRGYSDRMFECHIEPNWLLIYKKQDDILMLYLIRTGSHGDLFK